jgi:hypothetical protein
VALMTGRYTAWNVLARLLDDVVLIIKTLRAGLVAMRGLGVRAALERSCIATLRASRNVRFRRDGSQYKSCFSRAVPACERRLGLRPDRARHAAGYCRSRVGVRPTSLGTDDRAAFPSV